MGAVLGTEGTRIERCLGTTLSYGSVMGGMFLAEPRLLSDLLLIRWRVALERERGENPLRAEAGGLRSLMEGNVTKWPCPVL